MQLGDPSDSEVSRAGGGGLSRRGVLKAGVLGVGSLLLSGGAAVRAGVPAGVAAVGRRGASRPVRNVIFLVSDGMCAGTLGLSEHYSRVVLGKQTNWLRLASEAGARRCVVTTHSYDSVVTDSAAASSAWSIGVKCRNGSLSVAPDGSTPAPILMRAKQGGRAVGCVTTTTITHATPAGFYCNVCDRADQKDVGVQLVERDVDVALGGGRVYVPEAAEGAGVQRVQTRQELKAWADSEHAVRAKRVIGTFNDGHISMSLDRRDDEPSLVEMARAAIEHLGTFADGFFLQIEGGRVDHAGHSNDVCGILTEQLELDTVLGLAAEYALSRDDTLLIAATDHGTGGPSATFYGRHGVECIKKLSGASKSFEWVMQKFGALPGTLTPEQQGGELAKLLKQATGMDIGSDGRKVLARKLAGEQVDPSIRRNELTSVMGSIVGNGFGVQWVSPDHTGEPVEMLVLGAGSETVRAGMDNTELTGWMAGLMDLPPGKPLL